MSVGPYNLVVKVKNMAGVPGVDSDPVAVAIVGDLSSSLDSLAPYVSGTAVPVSGKVTGDRRVEVRGQEWVWELVQPKGCPAPPQKDPRSLSAVSCQPWPHVPYPSVNAHLDPCERGSRLVYASRRLAVCCPLPSAHFCAQSGVHVMLLRVVRHH